MRNCWRIARTGSYSSNTSQERAMKLFGIILLLSGVVPVIYGQGDWPAYGHDPSGQRYSTLKQIDTKNVSKLKLAWQYGVDPGGVDLNAATRAPTSTEAVPIMVGGVLYTPTVRRSIVALEPETGKEIWKYDRGKPAPPRR